jgi:hypothetical protein
MSQIQNDLKQLQKQIAQIKVFCEAVADAHIQGGNLRDILHKNMSGLIYRKSQPWFHDLDVLRVNMIKSMLQMDERIRKLEEKAK